VLFSAKTDEGAQVRMGPEDLRVIREVFAEKAREAGIPLKATARADRRTLAQEIEAGRAKVREKGSYVVAKRGLTATDKENWLPTQAPIFAARHGAAYQQRRAGLPETAPRPAPTEFRPLHPKAATALETTFKAYDDGRGAQQRFLELYAEKPKFAIWAINNRADLFGKLTDPSKAPSLTQKVTQIPKSWRDDAAQRLITASMPAPAAAAAIKHLAEKARKQAEAVTKERKIAAAGVQLTKAAERFGPLPGAVTTKELTPAMPAIAAPAERKRPSWWQRITSKAQGTAPTAEAPKAPQQPTAAALIPPKAAETPPRDDGFAPRTRGGPRTRG
jgi:hypothetical protein